MAEGARTRWSPRLGSVLEDALLGVPVAQLPRLVPGVALAVVTVVAAIWLTDFLARFFEFSGTIMVAIILGALVRNTLGVPSWALPGIDFCLKKLLRLGIILMGLRLSVFDALEIGAWGIPIVVLCVVVGLVITTYVTRWLKLSRRLGTLIAVGTSICGASAIVATAPGIRAKQEEVTYAIANITVFGIAAMFVYPYLAHALFGGDHALAGLFMGTSIHETAQVTGAAMMYDESFRVTTSPSGTDVAVVTKLVRNLFMVVVIPLMAYLYARGDSEGGAVGAQRTRWIRLVPLFVLGFLALAVVRSIGDGLLDGGGLALGFLGEDAWNDVVGTTKELSGYTLTTAMAAVGLGTAFSSLKGLGLKPFYVGLFAATMVGVTAFVAVLALGSLASF